MGSLVDAKRRSEEKGRKLLDRSEGGAGMLHNFTKPRPLGGGAEVQEDVLVGSKLLKRVDVKKARVEGTLAGGYARRSDGRQAVGKRIILGFGGSASAHDSGGTKNGSKQLQGKHRSWSRRLSSQSAAGSQDGHMWGIIAVLATVEQGLQTSKLECAKNHLKHPVDRPKMHVV